jgi:hypothetical protein
MQRVQKNVKDWYACRLELVSKELKDLSLCHGFDFYEVKKKMLLFFKKKREILLHF